MLRYPVGRYRVTTTATCGTHHATNRSTVRIGQKTAATTISRTEFRRLRRGMTRAQVTRIVGSQGPTYQEGNGRTSTSFDLMPFWRFTFLGFRDGRLVSKWWDVAHD